MSTPVLLGAHCPEGQRPEFRFAATADGRRPTTADAILGLAAVGSSSTATTKAAAIARGLDRQTATAAVPVVRHASHTGRIRGRRAAIAVPFPDQATGRPIRVVRYPRACQHAGRADRGERQAEDVKLVVLLTH